MRGMLRLLSVFELDLSIRFLKQTFSRLNRKLEDDQDMPGIYNVLVGTSSYEANG